MTRKSTPPSLQEELKKIIVWIVCNTTMNVAENSTCEYNTDLFHY